MNQKFKGTCSNLPLIDGLFISLILPELGYVLLNNTLLLIVYLVLLLDGPHNSGIFPINLLYSMPSLLVNSFYQ